MIQHDTVYDFTNNQGWYKIGVWDLPDNIGSRLKIKFLGMEGYSSQSIARGGETILYASCNNNIPDTKANIDGRLHAYGSPVITQVKFIHLDNSRHKFEIRAYIKTFVKMSMTVECTQTDSFTKDVVASTDPGSDSLTISHALFTHVVDNSGNVGIGTTGPDKLLHVETPVNTSENLVRIGSSMNNGSRSVSGIEFATNPQFYNDDNGQRVPAKIKTGFYGDGPLVANWSDAYISLQTTHGNSGAIVDNLVCRGGNVGIGTTNPHRLLDVSDSTGETAMHISGMATQSNAFIYMTETSSRNYGAVLHYSGTGSPQGFRVGHLENSTTPRYDFAIDRTSGNVGIGKDNPGVKLDVLGGSTTGTRDATLIVRGDGSDIVPLITAGSGGQTVKTIAGIELTSIDTPLSNHGRHSYIESVSAGSTYNTDIEFRARAGGGYMYSGGSDPAQKQARIAHNGYIYARAGTSATGADYAELFEWNDGNPENEDRTGMTVKLMEGGKIGIADANTPPNDIIGVISVIYGFLGNNHWDEWVGKYLKDGLGRTVTETVDMVTWRDEDDKEHTFTIDTIPDGTEVPETASYYQDTGVPKINPKYDKTLEYTERGKRKEWGAVGLVGRLRVMKAYPKHSRWIKLQDIDDEVEEYLAI